MTQKRVARAHHHLHGIGCRQPEARQEQSNASKKSVVLKTNPTSLGCQTSAGQTSTFDDCCQAWWFKLLAP